MFKEKLAVSVATAFFITVSSIAHAENAKYIGAYDGEISSKSVPYRSKTIFIKGTNGAISGEYAFVEKKNEIKGVLKACEEFGINHLKCIWQDSYGYGDVEFMFNPKCTKFIGMWNAFGDAEKQVWHGAK